jgi:hypothetical protein
MPNSPAKHRAQDPKTLIVFRAADFRAQNTPEGSIELFDLKVDPSEGSAQILSLADSSDALPREVLTATRKMAT